MPDCCMNITLRTTDLERFRQAAGLDEAGWWNTLDETGTPGVVKTGIDEADRGWEDERSAAAKAGIPFVGDHGWRNGCCPMAFAAVGGDMLEAPIDEDGWLVVRVDRDLEPIDDRHELWKFVELERMAKKTLGISTGEDDDA